MTEHFLTLSPTAFLPRFHRSYADGPIDWKSRADLTRTDLFQRGVFPVLSIEKIYPSELAGNDFEPSPRSFLSTVRPDIFSSRIILLYLEFEITKIYRIEWKSQYVRAKDCARVKFIRLEIAFHGNEATDEKTLRRIFSYFSAWNYSLFDYAAIPGACTRISGSVFWKNGTVEILRQVTSYFFALQFPPHPV